MTQPLALPNYSALGSIVTEGMNSEAAAKALKASGWTFAGGGAETSVYLSPRGDRVIKLIRNADSGQEVTLNAALEHPDNPHLPRVYGTLPLSYGELAAETEVLERPDRTDDVARKFRRTSRIASVSSYGQPPATKTRSVLNLMQKGPLKDAVRALETCALDAEWSSGRTYVWDLHGGNFMLRPSTGELVLNDTIYAHDY
jgi:hypothetical protein